ncbi:MAG: diacylglycerol kinase family protein [Chloroflexi bacterium]|nr:diacylglycerol kinase family protein [Chloroflexota bacterium]MCY3697199.1 diacylglycerol kinase family protein [Chloroflexota bacterium]
MQPQPDEIVFVLNPQAGNSLQPRTLTAICHAACEQAGRAARVIATRTPGEATETARQAHDAGAAAIFGCGGDGTLSALLHGLPVGSETALGAVPLGTANVWAYETHLPSTPMAAISAQLAALDGIQGQPLWVDTGKVWSTRADGSIAEQRFLLMASWGLDAAAVSGIVGSERRGRLKRVLGEPAYFLSAVQEAIGRKAWPVAISVDGAPHVETEIGLLTVGNTRMLGTWLEVNPHATVVDGELDMLMVEGAPWRALALSPLARHSWLPNGPGVTNLRFQRLEVACLGEPPPNQIDGDPGPRTAYAIDVEPGALRVLCPNPTSAVLGG